MNRIPVYFLMVLLAVVPVFMAGCDPDSEDGFEDEYTVTSVGAATLATGLNYPWGLEFVSNQNNDGVGAGSVIGVGNLLVANRGTAGNAANTVVQVDPHTGVVSHYSDAGKVDLNGEPAVDGPYDVAFEGPFAWIANDAGGLGSIAVTDPNPQKGPNGPTGSAGEPIDGPLGTGVFGDDDFGFIVLSVTPEHNSMGESTVTKIEVVFSQPVDPNTITSTTFKVQVDYSPLSPDPPDPVGTFGFSPDYTRVEFIYNENLGEATRYKIVVDEDVTDYRGIELDGDLTSPGVDDFNSLFTTGSGNPFVIWVRPAEAASYVPTTSVIEVGFSEQVRESSVTGSSFYVVDSGGDKVDGIVQVYETLREARLTPDSPLHSNTIYTVYVTSKVEDLAGKPLDQIPGGYPDGFSSWFSTGAADANAPQVASITPANGAQGVSTRPTISVNFTKPIDPDSRQGDYFTLSGSQGNIDGTVDWPAENSLIFTLSVDLLDDQVYTVRLSDVLTDALGNALDGDGDGVAGGIFTSTFSTGYDRLYVVSSYPENSDTGVSTSTVAYVNFSRPVNPATVTTATFYIAPVMDPENHIPAIVTVNPGYSSAMLSPEADLTEDTQYVMTVTSDVADPAGNPLDQESGNPLDPFTAHFTTGGEDLTPPCVFSIIPLDNAENIPVGTSVTVQFTEPILPGSVTSTSFRLAGSSGNVAGEYIFADGNATVIFTPTDGLLDNHAYTVILTSGITDTSGNGLDGDCDGGSGPDFTSTFETGVGGMVINEVVLDPQQDWNDSEGGDGNLFNAVPGTGTVTTSDEWIEIFNASGDTLDLSNWTLEMTDSTPETHVIGGGSGTEVFVPASASVSSFSPGAYLVIGNPIGSNNNDTYFALRNSSGVLVDDLEIGDDPEGDGDGDGAPEAGEDGNASDISDETIARVPNAIDTDNDQNDCTKQAASIGTTNSGSFGSGPFGGSYKSATGMLGASSIVSAGIAPDDYNPLSMLYFVTHTGRGVVYGVDLDDGVYYAFTGLESPVGVEFVPSINSDGQAIPGSGLLFVVDSEAGNIARVQMKSTGAVGEANSVSMPDYQNTDAVVYMTFPYLSEPVGIAYSPEHDRLYTACRGNGYILEFDRAGTMTNVFDTGLGSHGFGGIDVGDMGSGDVIFLTYTGGSRVDRGDGPNGSIIYFDPHP